MRRATIGPNAVLQTLRAARELVGHTDAEAIAEAAALPDRAPTAMIPEGWFTALLDAVHQHLDAATAREVMRRSGAATALYVATHRIPKPIRHLLAVLPARAALPLLLRAIARHAWTFVGAGTFAVEGRSPATIVLRDAPTCRRPSPTGGTYYEAAFEGLLRLAAPTVRVREITCQARGDDACRFALTLD